jgi:hypothetical protein
MYGITRRVNCPVKIFPLCADFDIRLIQAIRGAAHLQVRAHPPVDLRRVTLDPSEDGDVVYSQPTLSHHLLDISVAKRVATIPANAEEDNVGRIMSPLEG